jgi:Flp pilus assembly pilin Flp
MLRHRPRVMTPQLGKRGRTAMKRVIVSAARLARRLVREDTGQDLVEYGILAALIAVVVMAGVATLGTQINTVLWQTIVQNF